MSEVLQGLSLLFLLVFDDGAVFLCVFGGFLNCFKLRAAYPWDSEIL